MSTPTNIDVQLLGNGDAILFSISKTQDMNVNFVISGEEFVRLVRELGVKANDFPESPLRALIVTGER